jgi:osmotically-inducible protein OsmY
MKNNEELQRDVQEAIKWEPLLNAAEIGVTCKDGVVTLTGTVNNYSKKIEAEEATKKVVGVKAVVEKIVVDFGNTCFIDDNKIANEVLNAFKWNWDIPNDTMKVKVEDGWVTLEGELEWNYQKVAAKEAASKQIGVRGVVNNVTINSETDDEVEREAIEKALARNWSLSSQNIMVKVIGNRVTLNGTVASLYQKDEAGRIAWNAPGVWNVVNELGIEYDRLKF